MSKFLIKIQNLTSREQDVFVVGVATFSEAASEAYRIRAAAGINRWKIKSIADVSAETMSELQSHSLWEVEEEKEEEEEEDCDACDGTCNS